MLLTNETAEFYELLRALNSKRSKSISKLGTVIYIYTVHCVYTYMRVLLWWCVEIYSDGSLLKRITSKHHLFLHVLRVEQLVLHRGDLVHEEPLAKGHSHTQCQEIVVAQTRARRAIVATLGIPRDLCRGNIDRLAADHGTRALHLRIELVLERRQWRFALWGDLVVLAEYSSVGGTTA